MSEILYRRIGDNEYIPVGPLDALRLDNCAPGTYVVHIERNGASCQTVVGQDTAAVLALVRPFREELTDALIEAGKGKPLPFNNLTEELWAQVHKAGITHIQYKSIMEIIDQALNVLAEKHKDEIEREPIKSLLEKLEMIAALQGKKES